MSGSCDASSNNFVMNASRFLSAIPRMESLPSAALPSRAREASTLFSMIPWNLMCNLLMTICYIRIESCRYSSGRSAL